MGKYDKYFRGKYALYILVGLTMMVTVAMSYIIYVGIKQQRVFEELYETTYRLQEGLNILRAEEEARQAEQEEGAKLEDKTAKEMQGL
jgi:hypothetical protein